MILEKQFLQVALVLNLFCFWEVVVSSGNAMLFMRVTAIARAVRKW